MARPKKDKQRKTGHQAENSLIRGIDDLSRYEEFKENLLPILREELRRGTSAEVIASKFSAYAISRIITILATEKDAGKAMSAAKELLDRTLGKPAQKTENIHKFSSLKDEHLDALIKSRLSGTEDLNEEPEDGTH